MRRRRLARRARVACLHLAPGQVSVPVGGCVDFVNADAGPHCPESNPHPTHTQCPCLNMPAPIPTGGSVTVGPAPQPAPPATTPEACGFHDHLNPPM